MNKNAKNKNENMKDNRQRCVIIKLFCNGGSKVEGTIHLF